MTRPAPSSRSLLGLAVAVASVMVGAGAATDGLSATPALTGSTVLSAVVLPGLSRAVDHGVASPAEPMTVVVGLRAPNSAAESAYLEGLGTPGSPFYRHYLTPAQVADRFGVPASTSAATTAWLRQAGLTVDAVSSSGDLVEVHGPVSAVDGAFGVTEHAYSQGASNFLANPAAPSVPAALPVLTVVGLNTFQHFTRAAVKPSQDTCVAGTCTGLTTPADLASVYDQPATYTGGGQSVGVFGEGDSAETIKGLRAFEKANSFPQVPVSTLLPPGDVPPKDDPAGDGEWRIDVQATTGMAPGVNELRLYFGADPNLSDADVLKEFTQWADDPAGPAQMDASFGECEALPAGLSSTLAPVNPPPVTLPVDIPVVGSSVGAGQGLGNMLQGPGDQVLMRAALEGRTLFSSTGDTGSSCPVVFASVIGAGNGVANQVVPLTSYPASSPYVVGVGGTVLYTSGAPVTRAKEYPWTFGGGGDSLFIPQPTYQTGVATLPCASDSTGTAAPGRACRGIPDVSAQSGDVITNGYTVYDGTGASSQGAGTSLSSPLWAGMWARVNGAANGQAGFANPQIYRVGKIAASYARDFFDVSPTDTTTSAPGGNGAYVSQPGWDYATGWGTPRIDGLICDVGGKPSGRYATGVPGACPLTAQTVGTPAVAATTTTVAAAQKPVTKKAVKRRAKPTVRKAAPRQPTKTLAFTGLDTVLPLLAVALLGLGLALRRRRPAMKGH